MPLVIFDLDNTLIDRDGAFHRWATEFMSGYGLDPAERQWLEGVDGGGFAPRLGFMSQVRERYRIDEPPERLLARYRDRMIAHTVPYPQVHAVLDHLRAEGWLVAIATNGDTEQQQAKIRLARLAGAVDAVAVSGEVGAAKPDRRMFEAAARRCGARLADGGWMVGDDPTRDIVGGRAAGLRTIWMRHGRAWDAASPPPHATVDHLHQTIGVLHPTAIT
jgi:HAD superfamily hydrolase (TIGR01549 family)